MSDPLDDFLKKFKEQGTKGSEPSEYDMMLLALATSQTQVIGKLIQEVARCRMKIEKLTGEKFIDNTT